MPANRIVEIDKKTYELYQNENGCSNLSCLTTVNHTKIAKNRAINYLKLCNFDNNNHEIVCLVVSV